MGATIIIASGHNHFFTCWGEDKVKAALKLAVWWIVVMLTVSSCSKGNLNELAADARPVISIMAPLHFPNPPDARIVDEIERLSGNILDIEWVRDEIYADKMNTAFMTGSMKKATFVKYTDYLLLKNAIRAGAFWEIGPYLDDYANLRTLRPDILDQTSVDGKIYGLYTERPSSRQGLIIRKDWLDALGLQVPANLAELYDVMRQFTYGDPDGNGKQDTIGLTDRNDLVFGAFKTLSSYFGTPNNWKVEGREFIPEFKTQGYMDTMNFMKKLFTEGIINQDFAVTSKDVQRNLFIRGKAGIYIGSMQDAQRLADEAKKVNPNAEFTLANRIEGPQGYKVWAIPNYNGLFLFSKKAIKTEEELRQVLAFFDRSMDADIVNRLKYGIEGRHYELEGDKVVLPQAGTLFRASEISSLYTLMVADSSNPNLMKVAHQEPLAELADELVKDNEKFIVRDPTEGLDSVTNDDKGVELYKIISDATYNYILGNVDEEGFRKEVERWEKGGGSQIAREYEEAYFRR